LKEKTLDKGSYRLQVRIRKGLFSGYKTIQRQDVLFGIGDAFLIGGQSNASGYQDDNDAGIIQNTNNYTTRHAVSVIDRIPLQNEPNSMKIGGLPIQEIIKDNNGIPISYSQKGFSKLEKTKNGAYTPIYPRGVGSWCWGPLASKIIENQADVPVSFFNAASPNSEIKSWADKYYRDDAGNFTFQPYYDTVPCSSLPCPNNTTYWVYKQFRSSLQM
jgi:hypothetical protein